MTRGFDQLLGAVFVKRTLGAHAADNAAAPYRYIGILVGQQDGGADPLVSAARGVGAVDAGQDGHAQLFQFRMAVKGGAVAAPVGIDFLLLRQFYTAAVHDPHQGDVQSFGHIRDPKLVVRLSGYPCAGHDFIVETNDNGPFAVDFG